MIAYRTKRRRSTRRRRPLRRGSSFERRNEADIPILMGDSTMRCVLLESDGSIIIHFSNNEGPLVGVAVVLTVGVLLDFDGVANLVSVRDTLRVFPSVVLSD